MQQQFSKKEYYALLRATVKKLETIQLDLDRAQSMLGFNGYDTAPLIMALKSAEATEQHVKQFFAWNKKAKNFESKKR